MRNITFINAGAGSGKTYRLTTDLAHKLTMEGLDPSQVILTTYTELAATEFREKARKEILHAKDSHDQLVDARTRIACATQLDNAFIGTVHAISLRFIRKYWYLLDYGADVRTMSDQNQDFYMSQSISELTTEADRGVFRKFRDTFDIRDNGKPYQLFWLPELKAVVDKMAYYGILSVKESTEKSVEAAEAIFKGRPSQIILSVINDCIPGIKAQTESARASEKKTNYLEKISAIMSKGGITSIDDIMIGTGSLLDPIGKKEDPFYSSDTYHEALQAFMEYPISKDRLDIVKAYIRTLFALAEQWQSKLRQYKEENHVISFDDMEKIFLDMVTEEKYKEVQDDIASSFRLLMVDEFQDSNPIQLKIFNRISELIARNGGHSVWVGDPKQAIYGFRGSDSRFISEILSKFEFSGDGKPVPEHGPDMLGTDQLLQSWRSRPSLVNFSNKVFLTPFLRSGLQEKQIVLAPHYTADTDTMGDEPSLQIWRSAKAHNAERAKLLAAKIKSLLASGQKVHHAECDKETSGIDYRDVAVLCFSNSSCNTVAAALRAIGLPASCEEANLMQCREVYLLKTLLLFVQKTSDKMLRAELSMMLDDTTTEEILKDRISYVLASNTEESGWDHWMDEDSGHPSAVTIAKLCAFAKRCQGLSVYDTVVAIHEELDLGNVIEKWGDVTQRRHNLATVTNMAKAYDDMCQQMGIGSSILGFVNYLATTKPENKTDNSANTIKVLTYHRSKGLEWPVVILFELWKEFADDKDLAKKKFLGVNICEQEGQECDIFNKKHYISLFPAGLRGDGKSNLPELMHEAIVQQPLFSAIKNQSQEESLRLLYVGITRAKDLLVSLTSVNDKGEDIICRWPQSLGISEGASAQPWGEGFGETLEELTETLHAEETEKPHKYRMTANTPGENDAPPLVLSPSSITSFDDSFTKNVMVGEAEDRMLDMKMFGGEASDAVKGSCIHNIFAAYQPGDREGNLKKTTQTMVNYGFVKASEKQKAKVLASIEWLYDFLARAYGPATRVIKECPLIYPLKTGQVLHGEIDLQWYFTDTDGLEKCILIDYKTFPGKRNELEEHTEKYYAQLSAYYAALEGAGITVKETLIYYPVQAHVRKLTK